MIQKFHFNNKGEPGLCVAKNKCRYGGSSAHFPSEFDARIGYEIKREKEYYLSIPQTTTTPVQQIHESFFDGDKLKLPPDEYFIGDPYLAVGIVDQHGWNEVVESVHHQFGWENDVESPFDEKIPAVGATYGDKPLFMVKNFAGSGLHWSLGPTHRVVSDSGLIAAVPTSTMKKLGRNPYELNRRRLGGMLRIGKGTKMWRNEYGLTIISSARIFVHNDLVSHMFDDLNAADGVNKDRVTNETYAKANDLASAWNKSLREAEEKLRQQGA